MAGNLKQMLEDRENGICPFCRKPIRIEDFLDKLSWEEAKISGLCQSCQDKFFNDDGEEMV